MASDLTYFSDMPARLDEFKFLKTDSMIIMFRIVISEPSGESNSPMNVNLMIYFPNDR